MEFRPCIDLHNGKVKQIVGSSLKDSGEGMIENFVSQHPSEYYANLFKQDHLNGGHIIMLGEGNEEAAEKALLAYPGGMQVGGGITFDNAKKYLALGASHIIVTSYLFEDGQLVMERLVQLSNRVGKDHLVIDLSCRKKNDAYYVVTNRWQTYSDFMVTKESINQLSLYCDEFLIHGVDVEGKQQGIEAELIEMLAETNNIKITYAGGIRSLDDIVKVQQLGKNKVNFTIGSALDIFGGQLNYQEIVKFTETLHQNYL